MRYLSSLLMMLTLLGCQSKPVTVQTPMAQFESEFFNELWTLHPGWAFASGLDQYASKIKIPNSQQRKDEKDFLVKNLEKLEKIKYQELNPSEKIDYDLVKNFLQSSLWDLEVFKSYQWDASQYNLGNTLASVLENKKLSGSEKLKAIEEKLAVVPAFYEAAFANLQKPTQEHLHLAIKQQKSFADFLLKGFQDQVIDLAVSLDQKKNMRRLLEQAHDAVALYVKKLESMDVLLIKDKGFRSFRIGPKLYAQKFKFDLQSTYTAKEIYQKALKAKDDAHAEMVKRAKDLWPKYFGKKTPPSNKLAMVHAVLEKISQNHVQPEQFVETVRQQIPELWSFVEKKQLLTLDPTKPLTVRETPVYNRGFAGASVNAPGPFDPGGETFYEVTPLDGMSEDKQQSYLREYNKYTLQILNIHEAIPGHYTQLVYSLKSPSLIKKVFGNGTMIEGWAVYTERMMLEEGYGDNLPELWLMYYKWRLRVVSNTILDYSLHNLDMDRKQAMDLLTREAFQEKAEAEEKWNRATYSQVQLASYFTGFTEIYDYREEIKQKMGTNFNLKNFHEKFLSYGSAPIMSIKTLMNQEVK